MTTATDGDLRLLCRAVRANPDDDIARLVLADRYEENGGGSVPCAACESKGYTQTPEQRTARIWDDCSACDGTGSVPDRTNAARAELIRVQVELANLPPFAEVSRTAATGYEWSLWQRRDQLRDRESALLSEFADRWRRGGECERCYPPGNLHVAFSGGITNVKCPECRGTGDSGGLMRRVDTSSPCTAGELVGGEFVPRVTYHRGMKTITVPTLSECVREETVPCPACVERMSAGAHNCGAGNCAVCQNNTIDTAGTVTRVVPSPWLAAVARWHPDVEAVEVLGADDCLEERGGVWWWRDDVVYDRDPRRPACLAPKDEYPTAELARRSLARAVALWMFGEVLK